MAVVAIESDSKPGGGGNHDGRRGWGRGHEGARILIGFDFVDVGPGSQPGARHNQAYACRTNGGEVISVPQPRLRKVTDVGRLVIQSADRGPGGVRRGSIR